MGMAVMLQMATYGIQHSSHGINLINRSVPISSGILNTDIIGILIVDPTYTHNGDGDCDDGRGNREDEAKPVSTAFI